MHWEKSFKPQFCSQFVLLHAYGCKCTGIFEVWDVWPAARLQTLMCSYDWIHIYIYRIFTGDLFNIITRRYCQLKMENFVKQSLNMDIQILRVIDIDIQIYS